jgi:hypothetical protein
MVVANAPAELARLARRRLAPFVRIRSGSQRRESGVVVPGGYYAIDRNRSKCRVIGVRESGVADDSVDIVTQDLDERGEVGGCFDVDAFAQPLRRAGESLVTDHHNRHAVGHGGLRFPRSPIRAHALDGLDMQTHRTSLAS